MSLTQQMPYGHQDLCPEVHVEPGTPKRIRCFVRGCNQNLVPPTKRGGGDVCPDHGIRCHSSGTYSSGTYSYADVRRNLIVDPNLFANTVVGHPLKYEANRFHLENSEDTLTWNFFRSLQKAGCLHRAANMVTGLDITEEPRLYLWGLCLTGDMFAQWDLLIAARERFESNLPVGRPFTEPDIGLYLPSHYLILIEAKFTSPNSSCSGKKALALIRCYGDQRLRYLDASRAKCCQNLGGQLWRNMVFAEWMAGLSNHSTPAFLGNLTRRSQEHESCDEFATLLNEGYRSRFIHISWEELLETCLDDAGSLETLATYMRSKTASLHQAFDFV